MIQFFVCGKPRKCSWCGNYSRVGDTMVYNTDSRESMCEPCRDRREKYRQSRLPPPTKQESSFDGDSMRPFTMGD